VHRAARLIAASLLLAGCAERPGAAGGPDITGSWELAEGVPGAVPPSGATLVVDEAGFSGRSFCNSYSSTYRLDDGALSVDGLGGTEMGCEPDVMAAERAYLAALGSASAVTIQEGDLLITGNGGLLRFTPVAPVPDRPIEGTRWVLESLIEGETAASTLGEPATLLLDPDRRASASTGCRSVTGTWLVEDGALVVDDVLADGAACPADVERQDAHVTAVLDAGPRVEILEDRLTLTADDGRGLVYRAAG
jgi:heat shock protein HslJ